MLKALIVEDEVALQTLYGRVLENAGYETYCAEDGYVAIQVLEEGLLPQLMLLDIRMPNANGLKVLEYLQTLPSVDNMHVVIVSASRGYESYAEMLPSTEFILKPVMPSQLQDVAMRLHNLHR